MNGSGSEFLIQELEELEELLECPVCTEVPVFTPIYQCPNGHLLCSECHSKLQQCPQCRAVLHKIRSLFAEKMLANHSLQCRYAEDGCAAMLLLSTAKSHQKSCEFRELNCPVSNCNKFMSLRLVAKIFL